MLGIIWSLRLSTMGAIFYGFGVGFSNSRMVFLVLRSGRSAWVYPHETRRKYIRVGSSPAVQAGDGLVRVYPASAVPTSRSGK